jgi:hypothetical protein
LTWVFLGVFTVVSAGATYSNFGDVFEPDEEGISYRNVIAARLGLPRSRRVAWRDIREAVEYDGKTWFLTVEAEKRWVLDQLDGHERLRLIFTDLQVPVRIKERPRLMKSRQGDPR